MQHPFGITIRVIFPIQHISDRIQIGANTKMKTNEMTSSRFRFGEIKGDTSKNQLN